MLRRVLLSSSLYARKKEHEYIIDKISTKEQHVVVAGSLYGCRC
ncbi:unnamed protein product [Amoebophrya sp. A25]|nr:unnamed protein product [Amoebophrya sp. A25]|eukprot:GSA25T00020662001.1